MTSQQESNQAPNAEHGMKSQVEGGAAKFQVPEKLAYRFEAAKEHAATSINPSADKDLKSGMEPDKDRVRNITEVTKAMVGQGKDTRAPNAGFPEKSQSKTD